MTVPGEAAATAPAEADSARDGWVAARLALLVALAGIALTALVYGSAPGRLAELDAAVRTGQVRVVTISGGLPDGSSGCATQRVEWRQSVLRHWVDVPVQRGGDDVDCAGQPLDPPVADVGELLRRLQPGVRIDRAAFPRASAELGGWRAPALAVTAAFGVALGQLVILTMGPEPWRATRWAWFWLMGSVVGAVAFLLLSGPTPGVRRPSRPAWRLTGGWAFLLSMLLAGLGPAWFLGAP